MEISFLPPTTGGFTSGAGTRRSLLHRSFKVISQRRFELDVPNGSGKLTKLSYATEHDHKDANSPAKNPADSYTCNSYRFQYLRSKCPADRSARGTAAMY